MKKAVAFLSTLILGVAIFTSCEQDDVGLFTTVQMNQLTKDYSKSLENFVIDFRESNSSVFSRGIELDLSNLKEARTKDELILLANEANLKISAVYLEDIFSNLERIKIASEQSGFNQDEFEKSLSENIFKSSILRGSKIECLKDYDDAMATAAILTAACGAIAGVLTGGGAAPGCLGLFAEELFRAEISLYYCLQRVANER